MSDANEIYAERYVAFIDILGFSEHVRRSEHAAIEAEKLIHVLNRTARTWADKGRSVRRELLGEDFRSTSFSDCTVLSETVTPKGLMHVLYRVTQFALDLLANGFLLRGAIAKGLVHHSEHAVFGPAFLSAYDSEQRIARYPRIVVDRGVHEDFLRIDADALNPSYEKTLKPNLRHDDDGPVFVDIFSGLRPANYMQTERLLVLAGACREKIQARLDQSIYNPFHYEKLRWLAIYWNGVRPQAEHVIFPAMRDFRNQTAIT
jgi:hypothetical protein